MPPIWNSPASCSRRSRRPRRGPPRAARPRLPPEDGYLVGVNCRDLADPGGRAGAICALAPPLAGTLAGRRRKRSEQRRRCASGYASSGYRLALIGTALMSRDDPAAFRCGNLRRGPDSATVNGYTRSYVDQNLRNDQCRCDQRGRGGQCGCHRFRVCPEPAAGDAGAGGAARGARAARDFADRGRPASAADESGRDLPDPQAGLFSDRCRGFARIEDSAAHQGASGRALRPQDSESSAGAHRVRGTLERHR